MMLFTHGENALRRREKCYDYRITLEAYFPDCSTHRVPIHSALLVSLQCETGKYP